MSNNSIRSRMSSRRDIFFLLIVCASLFVTTQCQSCEEGRTYYSPSITCRNINGKFPPITKAIYGMKCFDCNIPVVDESTISGFKGDSFNLSFSHVQNISSKAFASFDRGVHKFLFEGNNIDYVGPKAFSNFSALDEVILRKNNIAKLPEGIFVNTTVSLLDLSQNHLSSIGTFAGLKVNTLNLSVNELTEISEKAFENITFYPGRQWRTKLQVLDLSNNFIQKIHPSAFGKFTTKDNTIRSLFLVNNKITVVENSTFSQLNLLSSLSLQENYISELYINSFKGLTNLNTLILSKNRIQKIPLGIFADLQNLELLDLSRNLLTALTMNTFSGLTQLTKLNVSHNGLQVLDDSHIFPLGRLITLDISDNKLKDLNVQAIMEHHYRLRVLVINDNFWTCTHLVQMYKQMNDRFGGFNYPAHHFDVPNLHGIACSRGELDSYEDLTFEDFLSIVSQDRVFEDLFDSRINKGQEDLSLVEITSTISRVNSIFHMLLLITIIIVILFTQFIVRSVCAYLYRRNALPGGFGFLYTSNQDDVKLI